MNIQNEDDGLLVFIPSIERLLITSCDLPKQPYLISHDTEHSVDSHVILPQGYSGAPLNFIVEWTCFKKKVFEAPAANSTHGGDPYARIANHNLYHSSTKLPPNISIQHQATLQAQ